jgi:hypothetical protein
MCREEKLGHLKEVLLPPCLLWTRESGCVAAGAKRRERIFIIDETPKNWKVHCAQN